MVALALVALLAGTPATALAGDWKLVEKQEKGYFVPLDQIAKRTDSRKLASERAGKNRVKRNETVRNFRENGVAKVTRSEEDVPGAKIREARVEGRYQNTYQTWPVVRYKVTTTTTPYVDYEIHEWQEASEDIFKNTYEVTEELSWQEPVTRNLKTSIRKYTEGPVEEIVVGPWTGQTSKREIGRGNETKVEKEEAGSRQESKRIGSVVAVSENAPVGPGLIAPGGVGFSAESGKGAATARLSTYQKGLALSGAANAKSRGRVRGDFDSLLALAARQPDLYDDGTSKPSWKLAVGSASVVFTPYGPSGELDNDSRVLLAKGERHGTGKKGASIRVDACSVSPALLLGDFKTPEGKHSSRLGVR